MVTLGNAISLFGRPTTTIRLCSEHSIRKTRALRQRWTCASRSDHAAATCAGRWNRSQLGHGSRRPAVEPLRLDAISPLPIFLRAISLPDPFDGVREKLRLGVADAVAGIATEQILIFVALLL